jgi:nucleolar MIF4G domain-containing protein 1
MKSMAQKLRYKATTDAGLRKLRRKQERSKKRIRDENVVNNQEVQGELIPFKSLKKARKPSMKSAKVKVDNDEEKEMISIKSTKRKKDPYSKFDTAFAAALRKEDAEIAELESKLGLGNAREKNRLKKEYAKLEGYGDDFGDFLDELDTLVSNVVKGDTRSNEDESEVSENEDESKMSENEDESEVSESEDESKILKDEDESEPSRHEEEDDEFSELDEEMVPMNDEVSKKDEIGGKRDSFLYDDEDNLDESSYEEAKPSADNVQHEPDHDSTYIYKPVPGEDIYGHSKISLGSGSEKIKYTPPHLRTYQTENADREEKLRELNRSLNNSMNRLSDDTLISVIQAVSKLYKQFSTSDVNESLWKHIFVATIDRPILMTVIIPVYTASLAGIHYLTGDTVNLPGHLMEQLVVRLWKVKENSNDAESKEASNLILYLCYLYNLRLAHSSFMFDLVRHLIQGFTELDIELLSLILTHSGFTLRSDDPSSLKEIVLSVQAKKSSTLYLTSSRLEFMISALTDLKNNKRKKQDSIPIERTTKLRKILGRIKSEVDKSFDSSSLRIRLQDILEVEAKGRWWKVGASWIGNQFKHVSDEDNAENEEINASKVKKSQDMDEEMLQLAQKYRMNSDIRRSIFCIIMGSADCDDAFGKLVRASMLKNRNERECVRVIMECCGGESVYNPFYSHLAARLCDYQPQCKFSFQLAFWDVFKLWNSVTERKAVNLSKLLYHLVVIHQSIKLSILKPLDMGNLEETAQIFIIVFFSNLFESIEHPSQITELFERGIPRCNNGDSEDSDLLRKNLSIFFFQSLKASPKNITKSRFRTNLKAAMKACEVDSLHAI